MTKGHVPTLNFKNCSTIAEPSPKNIKTSKNGPVSYLFNKLQGPLPNLIFELEKLETLDLYSNNLSGIVTMDMFHKLKYLTSLHLSLNRISLITKTNSNATQNKFKVLGLASCNLSNFPDFLHNQN